MRPFYRLPTLALVALLVGCASATALQKADGTIEIIGTSSSEEDALEASLDKGLAACKATNKQFVVIDRQSSYRGVDPNVRAVITIANALTKGGFGGAGTTSSDWRVIVIGKCQ